jgi:hypothetical protein
MRIDLDSSKRSNWASSKPASEPKRRNEMQSIPKEFCKDELRVPHFFVFRKDFVLVAEQSSLGRNFRIK